MNANKNVTNKFKNTTKHKVSKQISTAMYTIFLYYNHKKNTNNIQTFTMPSKKEQKTYNIVVVFLFFLFCFFFLEFTI